MDRDNRRSEGRMGNDRYYEGRQDRYRGSPSRWQDDDRSYRARDDFGPGQSGGGAHARPYRDIGSRDEFRGGQSSQGYYGGGQMGDRDYGGRNAMAGSRRDEWERSSRFDQHGGQSGDHWEGQGSGRMSSSPMGGAYYGDPYGRRQSGMGGYGQQGQPHHDEDYRSWRDRQMQQFDRDYDEFRQHRQHRFNSEFEEWRKNRGSSMTADQGSNAQISTTQRPVMGNENERGAPGISTDKKSDDTKR